MIAMKRTFRRLLVVATLCGGVAATMPARAATLTNTDEIRSWATLQHMKALEVMHMMDTDRKGFVTREEFLKFMGDFFDRMDKNREGKVDAQEWMRRGAREK